MQTYCFGLWILCELLIVKYSACSFLVFDVTLELYHSCSWNARVPAEEGAAVSGLGIATSGGHISLAFLLHFQFAVGRIRRASTKRQIRGWLIKLNIVDEFKVLWRVFQTGAEAELWRCVVWGVMNFSVVLISVLLLFEGTTSKMK